MAALLWAVLAATFAFGLEAPRVSLEPVKAGSPVAPVLSPQLGLPIEPVSAVVPAAVVEAQLAADLHAAPVAGGAQAQQALDHSFENARAPKPETPAVQAPEAGGAAVPVAALEPYVPHELAAKLQPPAVKTVSSKTPAQRARELVLTYAMAMLSIVNPTRVLLPAAQAPDASFLVQKSYGYKEDPEFTKPMAAAIAGSEQYLRGALKDGRGVSPRDVREMMNHIAGVRQEIAVKKSAEDWHNFGNPIPEGESDVDMMLTTGERPRAETWASGTSVDFLLPEEGNRHAAFYDQAERRMQAQHSGTFPATMVVDGESFPFSVVQDWRHAKVLALVHPDFGEMVPMRRRAFKIIADALNDKSISEARFMDRLAAAYQLLVHATPWVRGSPSIIEAYFDAALRAKFGKTLPPKTGEPFWDAALRDPRLGPYTGRDFLKNFGGA